MPKSHKISPASRASAVLGTKDTARSGPVLAPKSWNGLNRPPAPLQDPGSTHHSFPQPCDCVDVLGDPEVHPMCRVPPPLLAGRFADLSTAGSRPSSEQLALLVEEAVPRA